MPAELSRPEVPGAALDAPRRSAGPALAHVAVILALGLAAYSNTFSVPFQFDDGKNIVHDAAVHDVQSLLAADRGPARAVAFFTFALNGSVHGLSVGGYHAVNFAIHLAAALCVYLLAAFALRAVSPGDAALRRNGPLAALLAAALFVAHPVQTQAVTYVVQRMASLAALFYLGAVLAYLRAASSERPARRGALYAAALALTALALFTKENAATLPAALALADACFLPGRARDRAFRLAPFAALVAVLLLAVLDPAGAVGRAASELRGAVQPEGAPPWATYLFTQARVLVTYLRLLVLPVGQNLDYDYPLYASPFAAPVMLSVAFLGLALGVPAALAWRARRRSGLARIVLFAIGWFLVTLSVESSVIALADVIFEHRLYLPAAGAFLALGAGAAWAVERLRPRARILAAAALAAAVLVLAGATYARNEVWRNPETLWSDVARKSPGKSRPYVWLAQARMDRGDYAGALPLLERAAALPPPYPQVHLNFAVSYERLGRIAEAERAYREALATGLAPPGAHHGLALLLLDTGRTGEACDHFAAEVAVDRGSRNARKNLVPCLLARGDAPGAVAEAERLAAEAPGDAEVLYNLALGSASLGDVTRAREAYRRFLAAAGPALQPQQDAARAWLAQHP
jgi:protein O-mannosyl-transferase